MILHVLIAMIAGWIQRHQKRVITYRQEENRVLKAHLIGAIAYVICHDNLTRAAA